MPDDHKSKTFTWTSPAGVEITLPAMGSIKAGVMRRTRKLEPVDAMFSVLEEISDEDTIGKLDDLEQVELNSLVEDWQSDSGATSGESSA